MKTFSTTPKDIHREWYVVDAEGQTLGRLASRVASILRGKHKPYYAPYLDTGDCVIVVNSKGIRVTGNKMEQKVYTRYTGWPGGLRTAVAAVDNVAGATYYVWFFQRAGKVFSQTNVVTRIILLVAILSTPRYLVCFLHWDGQDRP